MDWSVNNDHVQRLLLLSLAACGWYNLLLLSPKTQIDRGLFLNESMHAIMFEEYMVRLLLKNRF